MPKLTGYSYNANGEQTGRTIGGTSYTVGFDYDGQVTSIAQGGNTVSYAYDTLGRWFYRLDASSNITRYLWGPGGILTDYVNGSLGSSYTIGNQMIRKDSEYPMFDGLGHERTVTNSSQSVTGSITFDAFGQTAFSSGSSSNPYMFGNSSGYRNDGDAGLIHVGARFYDPQIGRFTSRDTELDQHPYNYCEHDAINLTDPTGSTETKLGPLLKKLPPPIGQVPNPLPIPGAPNGPFKKTISIDNGGSFQFGIGLPKPIGTGGGGFEITYPFEGGKGIIKGGSDGSGNWGVGIGFSGPHNDPYWGIGYGSQSGPFINIGFSL